MAFRSPQIPFRVLLMAARGVYRIVSGSMTQNSAGKIWSRRIRGQVSVHVLVSILYGHAHHLQIKMVLRRTNTRAIRLDAHPSQE